jgi:multiple sugar transport system substrate-binding protein
MPQTKKEGLMETDIHTFEAQCKLNRRGFLRATATGLAGIAGVLALRQPPATAQERELTMLSFNNFVPQSDEELRRQAALFGQQHRVKATVDTISGLQIPQKLAAEVETRAGHDVVVLPRSSPYLYQHHLVTLDALAEELGKREGGWYDFCRDYSSVGGAWKALCWLWISLPGQYNKRQFDDAGLSAPDTWEALLQAGRVLKPRGHPVGIPISQTTDANSSFWAIMWSFGGKVLEADGKTIAMESPEMQATLDYYQRLHTEAMGDEVLSWDDAGNNRCLVSGRCCWIHNPISAYESARSYHMPIANDIYFHATPAGPAGRYEGPGVNSLGIWNFSPHIELAKDFLAFLFEREHFNAWITASYGYNQPPLRAFANNPIWQQDPKTALIPQEGEYARARGWPAKPNAYVQLIENNYILPNMAAKAVTGTPIKEAIHWGVGQVRQVFGG